MVEQIKVESTIVELNQDMASVFDLRVECISKGNSWYDIQIVHKDTSKIFGGEVIKDVLGVAERNQIVSDLLAKTGIGDLRNIQK